MQLNYREAKPIYEQVKDGVVRLLIAGAILPEEPVMPVRELSSKLAINPNAIRQAYRELEQEGYLYTAADGKLLVSGARGRKERRRAELLARFDGLIVELEEFAVSEEELMSHVTRLMKGDGR